MPQQGAPVDFGGLVLPNPNNIRPMADTDPPPISPLYGATFNNGLFYGRPMMDASNPAAAQLIPRMMQQMSLRDRIGSAGDTLGRAWGLDNVSRQYSSNTDADTGPPPSLSPTTAYAQRLARDRGDITTAAHTVGVNARSAKAEKIKKIRSSK